MKSPDVIIVGGGVIGCSIAYYLTSLGIQACLFERDNIGAHASSVAAGILAVGAHEPRNHQLTALAEQSRRMFPTLVNKLQEESGIDCQLEQAGIFEVALNSDEAAELAQFANAGACGDEYTWLNTAAARALEPSLSAHVAGALHRAGPSHIISARLTQAFRIAAQRGGMEVEPQRCAVRLITKGRKVIGVRTSSGEFHCNTTVIAAGPWTSILLEQLGIHVPVSPRKGQVAHLYHAASTLARVIYAAGRYIVPRADGTVLLGATSEPDTFDPHITVGSLSWLLAGTADVVPGLQDAEYRQSFVAFRPQTPDSWPVLGSVEGWSGLVLATGHGGNGILLAPVTGYAIAELICGQSSDIDLSTFALARFKQ